ncbi:MAG: hypothetical protein K8T20_17820 [Planctomycetes bacterium]|nr:hypothetical protein [Planctomycetota bacterium]
MNSRVLSTVRLLVLAALASLPALPARAEDADSQIRGLVRNLGYGAGIHNFKNYVLRGTDEYRTKSETFLAAAEKAITALRGAAGLKDEEKSALDGIEKVVKQYHANLATAQKMIADKKSVAEIDAAVKVDDAPALAGFKVLQGGRKWTAQDNLDAAVGYGGAIHNFKNYVLRGSEDYRTNALAKFKEAKDAIAALRADPAKKDMKKSLDDVEGTLKKYEDNVAVVTKMIADKKSITEIDAAVKVDDAAAVAAFEALRK